MNAKINMQQLDQIAGGNITCYDDHANYIVKASCDSDDITLIKKDFTDSSSSKVGLDGKTFKGILYSVYPDNAEEITSLMSKLTDSKNTYLLSGKERQMYLSVIKDFLG